MDLRFVPRLEFFHSLHRCVIMADNACSKGSDAVPLELRPY